MENCRQFIKKHGGGKNRAKKLVNARRAPRPLFPAISVYFVFNPKNNKISIFAQNAFSLVNDFSIVNRGETYMLSKLLVFNVIPEIKTALTNNHSLNSYEINEKIDFSQVAKFFELKEVLVTMDNVEDILNTANQLEIAQLVSLLTEFISTTKKLVEKLEIFSDEISEYNNLYSLFLDLTETNFEQTYSFFSNSMDVLQGKKAIVLNIIDNVAKNRSYSSELLVKLCKVISPLFENGLFSDYSMKTDNFFFLHELFINDLIDKEKLLGMINTSTPNLFCWFSPELEKWNSKKYFEIMHDLQLSFNEYMKTDKYISEEKNITAFVEVYILNIMKFYNNDWELHHIMTKNGSNPNEFAQKIREDDVDGFQDLVKSDSLEQVLPNSIFERSSIMANNPFFIEYAAFFGSVKIFKFLLMNHVKLYNSLLYAIAGGSTEIIRLCQQENSVMSSGYVPAVTFMRNNIFEWLYSCGELIADDLIMICFLSDNLSVLQTLIEKGFRLTNNLIDYCASNKNILLTKIYFALGCTPEDSRFVVNSITSGNAEVLKCIFSHIKKTSVRPFNYYDYVPLLSKNLDLDIIEVLMEYGKINDISDLLLIGCKNGSDHFVKGILDKNYNINVNKVSGEGLTPLMIAASKGFFEIVKRLVMIPEIDLEMKKNSINAAKMAAKNGHLKISSYIMEEIRKRQKAQP